ncbi:MAG: hypothetical protein Q8942_01645 [Bacillota bacterium]|nr:hypothetical protein [Bacillota bacterium]
MDPFGSQLVSKDNSIYSEFLPTNQIKNSLWESVGKLASINDYNKFVVEAQNIIPQIHKELLEVNSETRKLFGRAGDNHPWVLSDSNRVKLYKMAQKLADLQGGKRIRIKRKTLAQSVDVYTGILRLKISMAIIQVFTDSFKKLLPLDDKHIQLHKDVTFIFTAAVEIDTELIKALESNRLRNYFKSYC